MEDETYEMSRRANLVALAGLLLPAGATLLAACGGRAAAGTSTVASVSTTGSTGTTAPARAPGTSGEAARVPTAQLITPTEETVLATLRRDHPRLLLLPEDIVRIRQAIATDTTARAMKDTLLRKGEQILPEPPVTRVLVGPRLLDMSRKALERVYTLALLYQLDGAQKWAARATAELLAAASFTDWNPSHFLDVAEMSHALAIGYDWLFDTLSDQDRTTIKTALVEKGLRPAEAAYRARAWWAENAFNWNNVCNGGIAAAALAVAEDETELARFLLVRAIAGVPRALASYAPDGAWAEGPGYWSYATRYTVVMFAALESALGTDFGLSTLPGLAETGAFRLQSAGPSGLFFNFADAGERSGDEPSLFWLARRYDSPLLAWGAREAAGAGTTGATGPAAGRASASDLLWYDARGTKEELGRVGLDALYKGAHLAFFRSAWSDPKAIYVGFKGGDNKASHAHLDLGTFVLDALGQRWALDLGPDDYNLPEYFGKQRWTYYRLRTEGHNTLTLDGQNQDTKAVAPLTAFQSSPDGGSTIADLSAAYISLGGKRVRRGMALLDGRTRVLVQDELETVQPVDVLWAMHTRAEVAADGNRAVLTQGGATLEAWLLTPPGARFTVEPVTIPAPQRPSSGVRKLLVRLPDKVTATQIAVLLTPAAPAASGRAGAPLAGAIRVPKSRSLDQWLIAGPALLG